MTETNKLAVASYGEALWDCIPDGLFLGGAPFNAAYHLASLGAQSYPITCVGDAFLEDVFAQLDGLLGVHGGLQVRVTGHDGRSETIVSIKTE